VALNGLNCVVVPLRIYHTLTELISDFTNKFR